MRLRRKNLRKNYINKRNPLQRGGISMNSNILSLLEGKYEREIRFGKYNFMLNDVSKLFIQLLAIQYSAYSIVMRQRIEKETIRIISSRTQELNLLAFLSLKS